MILALIRFPRGVATYNNDVMKWRGWMEEYLNAAWDPQAAYGPAAGPYAEHVQRIAAGAAADVKGVAELPALPEELTKSVLGRVY